MILPLIPADDARLHQVCETVPYVSNKIRNLAADMLETMYASNGCGLAAPQIGHNIRLIVLDCSPDKSQPLVMVNPVITSCEPVTDVTEEGCLSFPGVNYPVTRSQRVMVNYTGLDGKPKTGTANFIWAVCVQHEIDHLDGITFDMRAKDSGLLPQSAA